MDSWEETDFMIKGSLKDSAADRCTLRPCFGPLSFFLNYRLNSPAGGLKMFKPSSKREFLRTYRGCSDGPRVFVARLSLQA